MLPSGGYFEPVHFPLANAHTPEEIEAIPWPVMTAEEAAFIRAQAEHWRREADYATLACFGGNILENGNFMFGFAEFMLRLGEDVDLVEYFLDRLVRWHLDNLAVFLPAVDGLVDVIACGDDLGTQTSLIVSPATYRRLIKPHQAHVYEHIRKKARGRSSSSTRAGAIEPILGDLIEIGIEIINPVQIGTRASTEWLKAKYGRHLTFWGGGCDHATHPPARQRGGHPERGKAASSGSQARRRLRLHAGPQHPRQHPAPRRSPRSMMRHMLAGVLKSL